MSFSTLSGSTPDIGPSIQVLWKGEGKRREGWEEEERRGEGEAKRNERVESDAQSLDIYKSHTNDVCAHVVIWVFLRFVYSLMFILEVNNGLIEGDIGGKGVH